MGGKLDREKEERDRERESEGRREPYHGTDELLHSQTQSPPT
jgi:hypothetical protein